VIGSSLVRRRPIPADGMAVLVVAGMALWTALILLPFVGLSVSHRAERYALPLLFLVPIGLRIANLLGAKRVHPVFGPAATWSTLLALAFIGAFLASGPLLLALAIPAVIAGTTVVTRYRAGALVVAFFFCGTFGTVTAFTPLRPAVGVDIVIGGLILGAMFRALAQRRQGPVVVWPGIALLMLYLLITGLEILTAPSIGWGLQAFRSAAWYILAGLVVAYMPWRPLDMQRITRGIVAVAALVIAYAIYRWRAGPSLHEYRLAISTASVYNFVDGRLRTFGSFTSGHELSAWASAVVPFCAAYALTFRTRWGALAGAAAAAGIVAIFASEVRTGLVAVAAGLAVVLVVYQLARGFRGLHLGVTALIVGVVLIAGLGGYAAVVGDHPENSQRFANILTPDRDPAYQARVVKWQTAVADLNNHPFGFGIGTAGRTQRRSGRFITDASVNVDNGYLKMAWEQGYATLALYVVSVLLILAGLLRRSVLTGDRVRAGIGAGAAGALTAFLVLLVTGTYDEGLTAAATWILVGLGIAQFVRPQRDAQYSP
jgi:hypothetical protein